MITKYVLKTQTGKYLGGRSWRSFKLVADLDKAFQYKGPILAGRARYNDRRNRLLLTYPDYFLVQKIKIEVSETPNDYEEPLDHS